MEKLEAAGRIVIDDTAGATMAEIDATRQGLTARGSPFAWHEELAAAMADIAARSRPGDVILLVGAHGMDEGARLLREAF